ncbi:MAG: hypothetical protein M0030_04175 [Actinomycetota bacterium]|nr:hypothetical protein [Actinomycetota bacterium]
MRMHVRPSARAAALASAVLVAGCGSAAPAARGPAAWAPPGGAPFLATSLVTSAGTWAVAVMGGSVASHDNFWQLFERPAGSSGWKLVTPPGTPDNGGLVLAGAGSSLITGFRPSQGLTYTPLAATADGGQAWASAGPLDGALANVPDALAAAPAGGHLLALTAAGEAELAAPGYSRWTTLATLKSLAATAAGRRCGLQKLTAAAFTPAGLPVLAGTCSRPGTAAIFADSGGTWQAAGPAIPAALGSRPITVLRLTQTANQIVALLAAGSGHTASLLAAWSADNGRHWALSPALALGGAAIASASFGTEGTAAVIMNGGRADMITSSSSQWHALPTLPSGTATLAPGPGGQADALAVQRAALTVWQLRPGSTAWAKAQEISVPIQYGSSS